MGLIKETDVGKTRDSQGNRTARVLHLSTFDTHGPTAARGAARGALSLTKALRLRGVESSVVVGRKRSSDPAVHSLPGKFAPLTSRLRIKFDRVPLHRYATRDEGFWTIGWLPCRLDGLSRRYAPDIVHLHWVGAGFLSIQALKQFRCPVVWTLRDMWAFTGGCHYTDGCHRYEDACGACPQLHSNRDGDLSRMVWQRKQKHWQGLDLWFVAISEWLACCVRSSRLLASYPIEVIPNGLDLDQFLPTDKRAARQAWDLPMDRQIITYGAIRATQDPRKGYRELVAAIEKLKETGQTENLLLVVFGDPTAADLPGLHIENRNVGYIDDDRSLSLLYSAADVAVVPSIEEAFGKTVIEAMACATPVVAFNTGGPKDIITHQHDGFLAEPYRPDDLAAGIAWCLDRVRREPEFGRQARAKVEAKFDIEVVAASYERLYRRILARARPGVHA